MFGYNGKIVRIDLNTQRIMAIDIPKRVFEDYLGGRALGTKILYEEVPPNIAPLSPQNLLIFTVGPFTNTIVPSSGRFSVTTKSPLTGIWASSDGGGKLGAEIKRAGFDGIIITGRAKSPAYLWIHDGEVEIRKADHIWGKDTFETDEIVRKETDGKAAVACIGQGGEKLVKFASISTEGKHARIAGRAGVGAVMGSKNLKAIGVKGEKETEVAKPEELKSSVSEYLQELTKNDVYKILGTYGSAVAVGMGSEVGDLPVMNWRLRKWEKALNISGEQMTKTILVGKYHCLRCPIGCGRIVNISKGKYAPVDGAGPEYESVAALGSLCLVDNLEAIAKANELCNRYGIDTMSAGSVIAFAIEAYEKKLISKDDVGLELTWADADAVIELVKMIGEKIGFGEVLSEGVRRAAQKIGKNAEEFAMHVKGLEFAMHDPRCEPSLGLGYATANRGACHLEAGFAHDVERGIVAIPELGYNGPKDVETPEAKAKMIADFQHLNMLADSLIICKYVLFLGRVRIATLLTWLNSITGWSISAGEFLKIGERGFNLARLFNVKCGISRKDDTLPPRILTYKGMKPQEKSEVPPLGQMLGKYYEYRGWSEDGIPTTQKLKELDLPTDLPTHLIR